MSRVRFGTPFPCACWLPKPSGSQTIPSISRPIWTAFGKTLKIDDSLEDVADEVRETLPLGGEITLYLTDNCSAFDASYRDIFGILIEFRARTGKSLTHDRNQASGGFRGAGAEISVYDGFLSGTPISRMPHDWASRLGERRKSLWRSLSHRYDMYCRAWKRSWDGCPQDIGRAAAGYTSRAWLRK
jgi:hypothetical protein